MFLAKSHIDFHCSRPKIQSSRSRRPSVVPSATKLHAPQTSARHTAGCSAAETKASAPLPSEGSVVGADKAGREEASNGTEDSTPPAGRAGRAWNETSTTWFKEKQKREEGNKLKAKRKEHETVLKDLEFIQSRRAAMNDRAHEIKLNSPKYTYHVRRWTAARTIQKHGRRHFLEWTKTHAWRPRVTLHPEFRMQQLREYSGKDWSQHDVPDHLLSAWGLLNGAAQ
mmetsp:Transcript_9935/g.28474  ORF Transcript_9935/g.28474 Transcript_9935/m.28474 type:complete len:226 (+) Transcript_9935:99-776(+)